MRLKWVTELLNYPVDTVKYTVYRELETND